jgi:hypothetical protein
VRIFKARKNFYVIEKFSMLLQTFKTFRVIFVNLIFSLSSDQEGQIAAPNIRHFVFIDALIIVSKLNTSDLQLKLVTTSAISMYWVVQ